jgi:hypothetical protein
LRKRRENANSKEKERNRKSMAFSPYSSKGTPPLSLSPETSFRTADITDLKADIDMLLDSSFSSVQKRKRDDIPKVIEFFC